uniref:Uncharacterized protein n=1 Tax=Octopus bimaculoides TaxID=37653 RepID=A0A0L8HD21_OCTBM
MACGCCIQTRCLSRLMMTHLLWVFSSFSFLSFTNLLGHAKDQRGLFLLCLNLQFSKVLTLWHIGDEVKKNLPVHFT